MINIQPVTTPLTRGRNSTLTERFSTSGTDMFFLKESGKHRSRQGLYEELLMAFIDAILELDINALNGFLESETLQNIKPKDIRILWQLCWWSYPRSLTSQRVAFNVFIASMRALYPWLQSPAWVPETDPESAH